MMRVPGFNPLAPIGEGLASGLSRGLEQGIDRGRFMGNLSAAQQLYQPKYDENGNQIPNNISPAQMLLGLYQASGGNPAFIQSIGEIFPTLLAEQRRTAGTGFNFFGNRDAGGQPNQPGRQPGSQPMHPQGQGMGQPQPPQMQPGAQPGMQLMQQPQDGYNAAYAPPQPQPGMQPQQAPPQQMAGSELGGTLSPDLYQFTPQDQEELVNQMVANNVATPQQAFEFSNQIAKNINESNDIRLRKFNAERTVDQEQRGLVDKVLQETGFGGGFDASPLAMGVPGAGTQTPPDELMGLHAYETWNRLAADPKYKNDTQRAAALKGELLRVKNAQNELLKGQGSPYIWQNPNKAMQGAYRANQTFLKSTKAYNPQTGQYEIPWVDRAIDLNMQMDWPADVARELAVPLSEKANASIRGAPTMFKVKMPKDWEVVTQLGGRPIDAYHIDDPKQLDKNYNQIAASLVKTLGPNDSLVVARRKLYNNSGVNKNDFNEILKRMEGMGYQKSPFQERELGELNRDVQPSVGEFLQGYSIWDMIKSKAYLR